MAPDLHVELSGRIPPDYVPDENLRIGLLRRLFRLDSTPGVSQFAEELDDRFGPPPPPVAGLLTTQHLRVLARAHRICRIEAGCAACALTPRDPAAARSLARLLGGTEKKGRALLPALHADPAVRAQALVKILGG